MPLGQARGTSSLASSEPRARALHCAADTLEEKRKGNDTAYTQRLHLWISSALCFSCSLFCVCRGFLFFFPFYCISHCPGTQDHCITSVTRVSCQPHLAQYSTELTHQILIISPIQQTNTIN